MTAEAIDKRFARLTELGTATVYEAQGQRGAVHSAIKPLDPGFRLVGRALTVDCQPADNLALHLALLQAKPGDVVVVDAKGFTEAGPWGDIMTLAAQTAGVKGLIIDGSVRDADTIVSMGFPAFSRGVCIRGTGKASKGKINVPIMCGGVQVNPGDIVLGDRDGVVVIPAAELDESIRLSELREAKEADQRIAIRSGKTTAQLLGLV